MESWLSLRFAVIADAFESILALRFAWPSISDSYAGANHLPKPHLAAARRIEINCNDYAWTSHHVVVALLTGTDRLRCCGWS